MDDQISSSAVLSDDGTYRYHLERRWGPGTLMTYTMLNPSTADAALNDQTVRRCMHYARREGLDGIQIVNLFALRSSDPSVLPLHPDPVGPLNDMWLDEALLDATLGSPLVVAWGANQVAVERGAALRALAKHRGIRMLCLGTNADGSPRHPSRLANEQPLIAWP